MIKEVIHECYNKATEAGFNVINENVLIQKIKEVSENTISSIGVQILIGSLALKACGISFGTSFPILLALLVAKSFITTLNHAKTVIKATLNGAKTVIKITAQKAVSPFMRVAEAINDIFKRVYTSFMLFAVSSYHSMKHMTYSSSFRGFNRCPSPIDLPQEKLPMIEDDDEPIETQELTIEKEPSIAENLAPSKPRLPLCGSLFVIQKEDTKKGLLLRGIPIDTTASKKEIALKLCFLKSSIVNRLLGSPMRLLLKEDNAPWMFFLEQGEDRPLKNPTSERLGNTVIALEDIPEALFLEGVPVSFRSPL